MFPVVGFAFEVEETYVGGTGRFAGATGSSALEGTAKLNVVSGIGTGEYTTKGTITY